jgi:Bacterial regulatory proteins, tetR family
MATSRQTITQTTNGPPRQQAEPGAQPDERQRREERILDAAAALLVRWGFRKTTIDDVAREAGVGKGTSCLALPCGAPAGRPLPTRCSRLPPIQRADYRTACGRMVCSPLSRIRSWRPL